MNNKYGITKSNLLKTAPKALSENESIGLLLPGTAGLLEQRAKEIPIVQLYMRIDKLPEKVLDMIAYDFKIDWYNNDFDIETKRKLIKGNFAVHRTMGTVGAVKNALHSVYEDSTVEEWFDYGGEPYHFRILVDASKTAPNPKLIDELLAQVNYYKNLRSCLDSVEYYSPGAPAKYNVYAACIGEKTIDGCVAVRF